jgi:hypothetical protein
MVPDDSDDTQKPHPSRDSRDEPEGPSTPEGGTRINRRSALQLFAVMGGVGAFSSTGGADADSSPDATDEARAARAPAPAGTDALLSYIEANFGEELTAEELDRVRDDVASDLRSADALDAVELEYTVDPAFTFRAYRGDDCR